MPAPGISPDPDFLEESDGSLLNHCLACHFFNFLNFCEFLLFLQSPTPAGTLPAILSKCPCKLGIMASCVPLGPAFLEADSKGSQIRAQPE